MPIARRFDIVRDARRIGAIDEVRAREHHHIPVLDIVQNGDGLERGFRSNASHLTRELRVEAQLIQIAMVQYQLQSTPGYLGALLSAYREFPFRLEELMAVVGLHSRPVLIVW